MTTDMTKTELAINNLTPELKEEHSKCLSQGLKDEVCKKCGSIFLAHHHFVTCNKNDCPMSNGKSFIDMWRESIEKTESPTTDKQSTALQQLNEWFKECHPLITTGDMVNKITELLEVERKQIEDAWRDAYATGCVVGGNDYTNETDEDCPEHYFTTNFKQQ